MRALVWASVERFALANDANAGSVGLISGGGTGIGRATALALCRSGADVVICGRRAELLEVTRDEVEALGGSCLAVQADIRDADDVERVIDAAIERFGAIDVVVNNAGGQFTAPAEEISDNGWRAVHRLAVDAAWSLTRRAAVRSMIPRRRGVVVFIGFSPRRGVPGMAHASAARAAVENLAGALACEWSRFGIRAVCVAPGNIETDALARYDASDVAAWTRGVPLGRLGTADEVATVIAFLASPGGSYVTGTTIVVDGGVDAWGQGVPPPLPAPLDAVSAAPDTAGPSTRRASRP